MTWIPVRIFDLLTLKLIWPDGFRVLQMWPLAHLAGTQRIIASGFECRGESRKVKIQGVDVCQSPLDHHIKRAVATQAAK